MEQELSAEKLEEVRNKIAEAIKETKERGIGIKQGRYGIVGDEVKGTYERCRSHCCPMGAVLLKKKEVKSAWYKTDAAIYLGVYERFVVGFILGFDGHGLKGTGPQALQGFVMGQEFRKLEVQ